MKKSGGRCSSGEPVPESEVARGCLPAEGVWASEGGARGALQARWQVSLTAWELVRRSGAHRSGAQQERDGSLPWGRVGNCREACLEVRGGGVREAGRGRRASAGRSRTYLLGELRVWCDWGPWDLSLWKEAVALSRGRSRASHCQSCRAEVGSGRPRKDPGRLPPHCRSG